MRRSTSMTNKSVCIYFKNRLMLFDLAAARYAVVPEGLRIKNVSLEDRGTYTCRAYQVSQVTSMYEDRNIKLNVQRKYILFFFTDLTPFVFNFAPI